MTFLLINTSGECHKSKRSSDIPLVLYTPCAVEICEAVSTGSHFLCCKRCVALCFAPNIRCGWIYTTIGWMDQTTMMARNRKDVHQEDVNDDDDDESLELIDCLPTFTQQDNHSLVSSPHDFSCHQHQQDPFGNRSNSSNHHQGSSRKLLQLGSASWHSLPDATTTNNKSEIKLNSLHHSAGGRLMTSVTRTVKKTWRRPATTIRTAQQPQPTNNNTNSLPSISLRSIRAGLSPKTKNGLLYCELDDGPPSQDFSVPNNTPSLANHINTSGHVDSTTTSNDSNNNDHSFGGGSSSSSCSTSSDQNDAVVEDKPFLVESPPLSLQMVWLMNDLAKDRIQLSIHHDKREHQNPIFTATSTQDDRWQPEPDITLSGLKGSDRTSPRHPRHCRMGAPTVLEMPQENAIELSTESNQANCSTICLTPKTVSRKARMESLHHSRRRQIERRIEKTSPVKRVIPTNKAEGSVRIPTNNSPLSGSSVLRSPPLSSERDLIHSHHSNHSPRRRVVDPNVILQRIKATATTPSLQDTGHHTPRHRRCSLSNTNDPHMSSINNTAMIQSNFQMEAPERISPQHGLTRSARDRVQFDFNFKDLKQVTKESENLLMRQSCRLHKTQLKPQHIATPFVDERDGKQEDNYQSPAQHA